MLYSMWTAYSRDMMLQLILQQTVSYSFYVHTGSFFFPLPLQTFFYINVKFDKCYEGEIGAVQNMLLCGVLISQTKEGFGFVKISADRQQDCQRERQFFAKLGHRSSEVIGDKLNAQMYIRTDRTAGQIYANSHVTESKYRLTKLVMDYPSTA